MIPTKWKNCLRATVFTCIALTVYCQLGYPHGSAPRVGERLMQTNERDVYDSVPKSLRPGLIARVSLFVKYRVAKQWTQLYDLLSTSTTKGKTRAEIVEDYHKDPGVAGTGRALVDFLPKETQVNKGGQYWTIYGCARLRGLKIKVDAFIIASREDGDWHFSDVDMLIPRDTSFRPCGYESHAVQKRRTR